MTVNELIQKAVSAGAAALTVGAGALVINVGKNDAVQDQKILAIQTTLGKLDEIDRAIARVDTKVDVMNQKLDDAKEQLSKRK